MEGFLKAPVGLVKVPQQSVAELLTQKVIAIRHVQSTANANMEKAYNGSESEMMAERFTVLMGC